MASRTERGIEAAVAVVAHQCEIVIATVVAIPGDEDLAVGLDGDAVAMIKGAAEVGRELAVSVKTNIKTAVAVVADEGEVVSA